MSPASWVRRAAEPNRRRPPSGALAALIATSTSTSIWTCKVKRCEPFITKSGAMTHPINLPSDATRPSSTSGVPMPNLPPVRIVLVDDDDSFRESLGLNLVDEGFDVLSCSSGEPALDYSQRGGEPDVILLDWRMPGMNGLEVLRNLRRTGTTTPVIFLTALSDDIYEQAALEGGAIDFIDKSRRLPILLKRLEQIAQGRRPMRGADASPAVLRR